MGYTRLNIVRDCWWLIPSGNNNFSINQDGNLSSRGVSFANSLNDDSNSTYVLSIDNVQSTTTVGSGLPYGYGYTIGNSPYYHTVGTQPYFGRLDSTNINPDRIKIYVSGNVDVNHSTFPDEIRFRFILNNHLISETAWPSGTQSLLIEKDLGEVDKERIFKGRSGDTLDWFTCDWRYPYSLSSSNEFRAKMYTVQISYSGETNWDNYRTGLPVITSYHYPTGISLFNSWYSNSGNIINNLDISHVNKASTGIGVDNTFIIGSGGDYIYENRLMHSHSSLNGGAMYNRYYGQAQKIGFNFSPTGIPVEESNVTRAILRLRMAHPFSGTQNENDVFSVQGWNRSFAQGNDRQEFISFSQFGQKHMDDYNNNINPTHTDGYVLFGKGEVVGPTGFKTYDVNLDFVDGSTYASNSGNISSITRMDMDIFRNLELRLIGLPSGIKISSSELILERLTSSSLGMYSIGHASDGNVNASVEQANSGHSYYWNGNGRNRVIEPFIDEQVFNLGFTRFDNLTGTVNDNTQILSTSGTQIGLLKLQSGFPAEIYNTYRRPFSTQDDTYPRGNFLNALQLYGSGNQLIPTYPDECRISCSSLIDNLSNWTCHLSYGYSGTYSDADLSKTLLFYGTPSNFKWHIIQLGTTQKIAVNYKNANGNFMQELLDIDDLGSNSSPTDVLISYIGNQNSGTFYFYAGGVVPNSNINYQYRPSYEYIGKTSFLTFEPQTAELEIFGSNNSLASDYVNYRTVGNSEIKNFFVSSIGFSDFAVTGYTASFYNMLTDSRAENFLNSRGQLVDLNNAGHSGAFFRFSNGSGYVDDYLQMYYVAPDRTYQWNGPLVTNNKNTHVNPSSIYVDYEIDINTNHPSGVEFGITVDNNRFTSDEYPYFYRAKRAVLFNTTLPSGNNHRGTLLYQKQYGFEEKPLSYSVDDELRAVRVTIAPKAHSLGETNFYADVTVKKMRVYFDNIVVAGTGSDDVDLYTQGAYPYNANIDLYIQGYASGNQGVDLYIANAINYSGTIPLYTIGGFEHDDMTLYTNGMLPGSGSTTLYIGCGTLSSGNITLFTEGIYRTNAGTTLFTKAPTPKSGVADLDLFIWSTTNSGVRNTMPLMMEARDSIMPDRVITLYTDGGYLPHSGYIPLYIGNSYESTNNSLNLYTYGPEVHNSSVPLIVAGFGTTSGAVPANSNITLFIARDNESDAHRMMLYIGGPNVESENVSLYTQGAYIENSSVSLYNNGAAIETNNNITLFNHGF